MRKFKASLIALLVSNLYVVIGLLFLGWNELTVLLAYWLETFVVGVFTVLKIKKAEKLGGINMFLNGRPIPPNKKAIISFFIFHFSVFMFAHLFFVLMFFNATSDYGVKTGFISAILYMPVLLFSHGVSYYKNFIGKKEYNRQTVEKITSSAYPRVVIMHIAVILGFALGLPGLVLVAIKLTTDVFAHLREHEKIGKINPENLIKKLLSKLPSPPPANP